jgi:hypothetical protein
MGPTAYLLYSAVHAITFIDSSADEMAQTEGLVHKWAPLKPLADKMLTWKPSTDSNNSGWNVVKKKKSTLTRLHRLWSIETGKVELLYSIPVGVIIFI